ncbi:GNAT superfamily N-acetyltransferase [Cytobacillus horneckiae]|uniref:N-acetyltransferase n=1 Tax=Cytobacillus horneckiae TaxID=549687 RepID=A0A2N0ZF63_9BACI|nr:GNAT family N-acetyltransferase [Cytobacillus horneckiae]NRG47386.1 GNAT family N-acetyltransferase [Bacillus sp. CRN 9]MBN6887534.1 GNAT family N-acetyltransferase [Cytobacillus horneckiae]MCM3178593.1 GNAT family N-acetyltransferase [Cytobacillus horneckiae]MEC1155586.1 GNAT family N-acetyltransferase [Cytobacillus horneckiae]MED2936905.1 GNAT family N-acetyltransferase [Cytobacillus horneckiae]
MHWYEKLNQYFPIEEMKSKEHMETLLKERPDIYHKDEGPMHVLMYVELDTFVFIDYLFVSKESRGLGLGRKLIEKLKEKGKPIILEVEPVDYEDTDTEKRLRFYKREGFEHAQSIGYRRRSLATREVNEMEILYWAPENESEEMIFDSMKKTYELIHTYKDTHFYGESYQPVDEVLTFADKEEERDMLKDI